MDIASINKETDLLHPGAHMFWDDEEIRSKFMNYLATWSKNTSAYIQKGFYTQDSTTSTERKSSNEEAIEVGFVDGLFEMYKLREEIRKARAENRSCHLIITSLDHFFLVPIYTSDLQLSEMQFFQKSWN